MLISGFQKLTLLDYPNQLASLIFTLGCNFRCGYCHNPEFVDPKLTKNVPLIPEEKIFKFLENRKKFLDGVVISGGEPTIQPDLIHFIKKLKKLNYLVKLDTNGTNPLILEKLIKNKLIDYIAMDIKGNLKKYSEIVNVKIDTKTIEQSIELIKKSDIDYEFRMTTLPLHHDEEDIKNIGELIKNCNNFYIQNFRCHRTLNPKYQKEKNFQNANLQKFAEIMKNYVKIVQIRE